MDGVEAALKATNLSDRNSGKAEEPTVTPYPLTEYKQAQRWPTWKYP